MLSSIVAKTRVTYHLPDTLERDNNDNLLRFAGTLATAAMASPFATVDPGQGFACSYVVDRSCDIAQVRSATPSCGLCF